MNGEAYRRSTYRLAIAAVLLSVLCGWLYLKHTWRAIEIAFAADQTEIFDDMRTKALASTNPREIAGYLQYAVHYYPSGTKQQAGSLLDQVVERLRASVVRDIVAHLRSATGHDLGDDPERWIDEYSDR
jgi:hypothetical protein